MTSSQDHLPLETPRAISNCVPHAISSLSMRACTRASCAMMTRSWWCAGALQWFHPQGFANGSTTSVGLAGRLVFEEPTRNSAAGAEPDSNAVSWLIDRE